MRYLNILLGLAMLAFAAVQYNDPDMLLWIVYYAVPAAWAFLAAFRLDLVRSMPGMLGLWASIVVGLGVVVYYWPAMPGFWRPTVFMVEVEGEGAREGMGLMIAWAVLLLAMFSARRRPDTRF
jgi:Transmembrane family 220, helix